MHLRLLAPLLLTLVFLLSSSPALAAAAAGTIPAGFAPGSIWASKMSPAAGDKVSIYTVVYNSSSAGIEGAVSFYVDGAVIDSAPFTLPAGDTSVKSVSWTAVAGTHGLRASVASAIETSSKLPANLAETTTSTTTITVSAAAPATQTTSTATSTSNIATDLLSKVASTSPIVGTITNTVVHTTESIRQAGQTFLENQSATSAPVPLATSTAGSLATQENGQVLGTTTYKAPILGTPITKTGLLASASRAILPLFKYPALFYPVFFFILAFLFFFIAGKLRNPKRR